MAIDITFRLIAFVLLAISISISGYHRRRAAQSGERITFEGEGKFVFYFRTLSALMFYIGMLAYLIYPPAMAWARVDLPQWLRWLGLGLLAFMPLMAYWIFSNLGKNVTPTVVTRREHELVTSGPYRWVRHPLYTVGLVAFLGFALMAANWFLALAIILAFTSLVLRTEREEQGLIDRFGDDYRQYMRRTGRFFPKLSRQS